MRNTADAAYEHFLFIAIIEGATQMKHKFKSILISGLTAMSILSVSAATYSKQASGSVWISETVTAKQTATFTTGSTDTWSLKTPLAIRSGTNTNLMSVSINQAAHGAYTSGGSPAYSSKLSVTGTEFNYSFYHEYITLKWIFKSGSLQQY